MTRPVSVIFADLNTRDLVEPLERIAKAHHVTSGELLGRSRYRHVVRARDAFLGHLVAVCGFSANCAAKILGMDHSSVLTALKRLQPAPEPEALATPAEWSMITQLMAQRARGAEPQ